MSRISGQSSSRRYLEELRHRSEALQPLLERVKNGPVTFVFASRETRFNNAVVLKEYVDQCQGTKA